MHWAPLNYGLLIFQIVMAIAATVLLISLGRLRRKYDRMCNRMDGTLQGLDLGAGIIMAASGSLTMAQLQALSKVGLIPTFLKHNSEDAKLCLICLGVTVDPRALAKGLCEHCAYMHGESN